MYKIYINDQALILCNSEELEQIKSEFGEKENILISLYQNKPHQLLSHIDMMEKIKKYEAIIVYGVDDVALFKDFKSLFKYIKAGGGVVSNASGEILMIHRRGAWDLPKGKKEKGETKKQTSVREVEEETGIKVTKVGNRLINTYHTYKIGSRRVLKKSYWYCMETDDIKLTPQTEEDIALAEWKSKAESEALYAASYPNIVEVLRDYWAKY